jgi:signal transduction histidine kinase
MRRSVWIFLASIFLPSLGLAWMAARSAQDQQVVLEHQQVIISQNITDTLAQNVQARMDQTRADFTSATRQLLDTSASPMILAEDFNRRIHEAWPLAAIGFAVNLDGEIYSPKPYEGPEAKTFRAENDRFLSNRENAEVYSSNAAGQVQTFRTAPLSFPLKKEAVDASAAASGGNAPAAGQGALAGHAFDKQMDLLSKDLNPPAQAALAPMQNATNFASTDQPSALAGTAEELRRSEVTNAPSAKPIDANVDSLEAHAPAASAQLKRPADFTMAALGQGQSALHATDQKSPTKRGVEDEAARDKGLQAATAAAVPAAVTAPMASSATSSVSPPADISKLAPAPAAGGSMDATDSVPAPTGAASESAPVARYAADAQNEQVAGRMQRLVIPQKMAANDTAPLSNTVPEESDFRRVIGSEPNGSLARFLENQLRLMVWSHPADTTIVFGAQLDPARLAEALQAAFQIPALQPDSYARSGHSDYCVAILDDTGRPVALSIAGFTGDWKHPFVATEIGEALPHWEAALYLTDPQQISRAARTLQLTLGLIVLVLVAAIVAGGSLIAADVRRQMRLAQQKTDFVSNVSHELKTPLTSIRMFADLLAEKRVPDEQRQSTYLRIISAEAARLTRLINNVLDFARLERGAPPGEHRDGDLVDSVRDVVETCAPHLEAAGVAFQCEIEAEPLPIHGDRDALAQIILNLISNAEKYGGSDVLVRVRRQEIPSGALGCVDVLDRGPGVPAAQVRTIFEPFQRLDDSLSSGIPGSGLGLTLARRMARSHGGDVTYSPRAGGGSCFTLTVPLLHPSLSS